MKKFTLKQELRGINLHGTFPEEIESILEADFEIVNKINSVTKSQKLLCYVTKEGIPYQKDFVDEFYNHIL